MENDFILVLDLGGPQAVAMARKLRALRYYTEIMSKNADLELLRRNFRDHTLTVSKLAGACFVSEVYFRRLYREAFGCTPMQTILELRFSYACTLLRAGYYTCRQAAEMAGFADVKYFRTAFRRRFGITPTQYAAGQTLKSPPRPLSRRRTNRSAGA